MTRTSSLGKALLFALVAYMMFVVVRTDLTYLTPTPEIAEHYTKVGWWLLPHGIAGALALFLGPLQFSNTLRQRKPAWHRAIGRTYVYGAIAAAPLGVYLEWMKYVRGIGSLRLVFAIVGLASLWLLTTVRAFVLAKKRRILEHREYMVRSYAVAAIFLETRVVSYTPLLSRWFQPISDWCDAHSISDMWVFVLAAPVIAEVILHLDLRTSRRAPSVRSATSLEV